MAITDARAHSSYGLVSSLNHRFSKNFQTQVSYTFSKALDDGSGTYGLDGGGSLPAIPYCEACDKGRTNFDRTQNFRISGVYQLPFKQNQLVQGWQFTWVYTYLTGAPFSPADGFARVYNTGGSGSSRPNLIQGCQV